MPPPALPSPQGRRPAGPPPAHRAPPVPERDPDALPTWTFRPIGVVRSPYRHVHDAPRQGTCGADDAAEILLRRGLQNCVRDLAGLERAWVVFVLSYARGFRHLVTPPRDTRKRGVLATRAPHRPNPIGLTCVRILGVRGREVRIAEHDLLDGTPVLDLKPYLPYCDAHPDAGTGWAAELRDDAPDHRWE